MHVADQRCFSAAPGLWQVREPDSGTSDPRAACIQYAHYSDRHCNSEQSLDEVMKVHRDACKLCEAEDDPRGKGHQEEKAEQTKPDGRSLIDRANGRVGIAKRQERAADEAHRQNAQSEPDAEKAASSS